VGLRAGLDAVVKRKISQPLPGLEPPFIEPVLYKYEGWLVLLGKLVDID